VNHMGQFMGSSNEVTILSSLTRLKTSWPANDCQVLNIGSDNRLKISWKYNLDTLLHRNGSVICMIDTYAPKFNT
jgi:hypothetical protein